MTDSVEVRDVITDALVARFVEFGAAPLDPNERAYAGDLAAVGLAALSEHGFTVVRTDLIDELRTSELEALIEVGRIAQLNERLRTANAGQLVELLDEVVTDRDRLEELNARLTQTLTEVVDGLTDHIEEGELECCRDTTEAARTLLAELPVTPET